MSDAANAVAEDWELQRQLDQLIPPPLSTLRKFAIGSSLLLLAVGVTMLNYGGYVVPRPFDSASFSSGSSLVVDRELGLVAARVMIPNFSQRTVRVTAVEWDAPGAELVRAELVIDADGLGADDTDGSAESVATPWPNQSEASLALPASIDPGERAFLVLWFRPLECTDSAAPWGVAEPTFDFGEGAFPPISRTIRIEEDPVWENEESIGVLDAGEWISSTGPLAVACEVLR
jgi:hypothetical protein